MSAPPACPTPAPVPPCPHRQAGSLRPPQTQAHTCVTHQPHNVNSCNATLTHTHAQHTCLAPTQCTHTKTQRMPPYVHPRSSDVSATSLPNAGASATMPTSPSPLSATTTNTRTHIRHTPTTQRQQLQRNPDPYTRQTHMPRTYTMHTHQNTTHAALRTPQGQ